MFKSIFAVIGIGTCAYAGASYVLPRFAQKARDCSQVVYNVVKDKAWEEIPKIPAYCKTVCQYVDDMKGDK